MFKATIAELATKAGLHVDGNGAIWAKLPDGEVTDQVAEIIELTVKKCLAAIEPEYEDGDIAAIHHHNNTTKIHRHFGI